MSGMNPGRWSKALLDAVVIVGSLLLAFGIDAARNARSEARLRGAFFLAINREMTFALSEVDRVSAAHRAGLESA